MKIPTSNVIIAFNRQTIDRLFAEGATYQSLMKTLTEDGEDDAVMFNAESNPNFVAFEHDFGFSPGMKMKLTFIDPKGEFEGRYLTTGFIENVAGYNYKNKENLPTVLNGKNNTEMKVGSQYSEEFYADLKKEYNKEYGNKEIYVAYGTGENLDLWSGPHRTVLQAADISVEGARKITLTLAPTGRALSLTQRRGAYNEKVNLNLAGLTMRYSGESKPINFWKGIWDEEEEYWKGVAGYDPLEYLNLHANAVSDVTSQRDETKQAFDTLGLKDLKTSLGDFDLHSIIVDALRNYIQNATGNPNVIVLLPNINLICRKYIDEIAKNARVGWSVETTKSVIGALFKSMVSTIYLQSDDVRNAAKRHDFIHSFLNDFGMSLMSYSDQNSTRTIDQGEINKFKSYEKKRDATERFQNLYTEFKYIGVIEKASNKGIPDHMGVVKGVIDKIKEHSKGEYPIQFGYFNESETKILDFWSSREYKTKGATYFPLFGGYRKFDAEQEAIIVGDIALIQNYLYARIDLKKQVADGVKLSQLAAAATTAREAQDSAIEDATPPVSYYPPFQSENQNMSTVGDYEQMLYDDLVAEGKALKAKEDAAVVAKLKHIPLHPLDRAILTNTQYNRDLKKIAFPDFTGDLTGSFGDITYLPDEFGYSEFADDKEKYIKEKAISVFRYNTTNPNVVKMKFKFGGVYFANLQIGFQKMVDRRASNVANGVMPLGTATFPITTRGDAAAFLMANNYSQDMGDADREQVLQDLARRMSPDLAESMKSDELEGADAIAALLDEAQENDLQGYVEIQQLMPGNPNSTMTEISERMYREALDISIDTLPSFHLSKVHTISSPCILFAQDAAVVQSEEPTRTPLNSFFSGLYKIMGFKHTIDSKGASSQFKLTKNAVRNKDAKKDSEIEESLMQTEA